MDEKELSQVAELTNGDIGTSSGLETLNTTYTDTDMSGLDHGDIIGAVANREKDCFEMALDQLDDQGFLKGRYTATDILVSTRAATNGAHTSK